MTRPTAPVSHSLTEAGHRALDETAPLSERERFFVDNLLVRVHCIINMIWWTGLATLDETAPLSEERESSLNV